MWILSVLDIAVKRRRMIILTVLIVTVIAIVASLLLPRKYAAVCTMLPPQEESPIAGLLGAVGANLSQAAASFALPFMATPSDLYASILESETVLLRTVDSLNLMVEYDSDTRLQALGKLRESFTTEVTPEGIVRLQTQARTPELAAALANTMVAGLNAVNSEIQIQKNQFFGEFLGQRVRETETALAKAQGALLAFQRENMAISLDAQSQAMIDIIAQQQAELNMTEIEYKLLRRQFDENYPGLTQLSAKISALREKLQQLEIGKRDPGDSTASAMDIPLNRIPDLTLRYAELMRDLKIQEMTYEMLYQQWEIAQIQSKKDVPVVAVLDRALPPEEAIWPRKKVMVVSAFLLSLILAVAVAVVQDQAANLNSNTGKILASLAEHYRTIRKGPLG